MNLRGGNFLLANETGVKPPRVSWRRLKNKLLGRKYDLSLVMASKRKLKLLAGLYGKEKKAGYEVNVLAFPLSEEKGEIFLNLKQSFFEAENLGYSRRCYAAFLYLHALFHLAGYSHRNKKEETLMNGKTRLELKKIRCVFQFKSFH